jgi:hypothetical protein
VRKTVRQNAKAGIRQSNTLTAGQRMSRKRKKNRIDKKDMSWSRRLQGISFLYPAIMENIRHAYG